MALYKLVKPIAKISRDRVFELLDQTKDLSTYVARANSPEYLYWDRVRHIRRPEGITAEEFWSLIKLIRTSPFDRVSTPIRDEKGEYFTRRSIPGLDHFLHETDLGLGGVMESSILSDLRNRQKFISRGIMEEAIASSQLEGANTTRKAAKRMILENREPKNGSEQMICNNYQAMILVEELLYNKPLNMSSFFDLHAILVKDTVDSSDIGRLRKDSDEIVVSDPISGFVYHIPPSEQFLKKEIKKLISFANDKEKDKQFIHPVLKAIILHFWIGYLHPFTDGNGRLARTIFYWYLLRKQYWAFTYLPLSRIIKNSPAQYRDAYIYSEQDDNDLTYFIDYNIRKIKQAKRDFSDYIKRKEIENRKMAVVACNKYNLNDRQIQLLRYFHKNSGATTTIKTHANVYSISRVTARKDLEKLEILGFLISRKEGKVRPFRAIEKISELF
jgi:Fic family protein